MIILDNFLWDHFWHFWQFLTLLTMLTMIILETCGLWVIDYNSDNWEPEFMTIFVTWQLRVAWQHLQFLHFSHFFSHFLCFCILSGKRCCVPPTTRCTPPQSPLLLFANLQRGREGGRETGRGQRSRARESNKNATESKCMYDRYAHHPMQLQCCRDARQYPMLPWCYLVSKMERLSMFNEIPLCTSRYFEILEAVLANLRYTQGISRHFEVLPDTSRYFEVVLGTLRYFYFRYF